jgi:hypothetical protein
MRTIDRVTAQGAICLSSIESVRIDIGLTPLSSFIDGKR